MSFVELFKKIIDNNDLVFDKVKELVEYKQQDKSFDINIIDNGGYTALFYATKRNHFEITKYLIEQGANVNINPGPRSGYTILINACYNANLKMVKYIVESGANTSELNYIVSPMFSFKSMDNIVHILEYLDSIGVIFNESDIEYCLYNICNKYHIDMYLNLIKYLIDYCKTKQYHNTSIKNTHGLIRIESFRAAKLLLENNYVDANELYLDATTTKYKYKNTSLIWHLIDTYNCPGQNAVVIAVELQDFAFLKHLVEKCRVNIKESNDILNIAIKKNNLEIVKYLVCCGCHLSIIDINGQGPLTFACKQTNYKLVKFLVEYKNIKYQRDFFNKTPLDYIDDIHNNSTFNFIKSKYFLFSQ